MLHVQQIKMEKDEIVLNRYIVIQEYSQVTTDVINNNFNVMYVTDLNTNILKRFYTNESSDANNVKVMPDLIAFLKENKDILLVSGSILGEGLCDASYWGHLHVIELLITRGANLNYIGKYGESAFHKALYSLDFNACLKKLINSIKLPYFYNP